MFGGEGVYWIRSRALSSKFIDVHNNTYVHGGNRDSMPIGLLSPRFTRSQLWLVEQVQDGESFIIRNYDTGTVLDIQGGSSTEGTPIVVRSYKHTGEDVSSQHWQIAWDSDYNQISYYCLMNRKTKTVLEQTRNTHNGTEFSIEACRPDNCQRQLWSFERATFPTMYWLFNISSQRYLQCNFSTSDAASLDVNTKFPSRNQLWYLESVVEHDDYYRIRNVDSEDKVLELFGDGNTSMLACTAEGSDSQRWKIIDVNMNGVVSIVCSRNNKVLYAQRESEGTYHPRGGTDANTFGGCYQWRLIPCPIPSLFWTTVQCRGSGKFISQSNGGIAASDGARGEVDYTVQWRFLTHGHNPYFTIINRQTGNSLHNSSGSAFSADTNNSYHWALDAGGEDYSIINLSTSNVIAWDNGQIRMLSGDAMHVNRQWFINASFQSVPSFAIINGTTGMALAYVPNVTSGSITTDTTFNSYRCQWIFRQIGNDPDDRPIYSIVNKHSGEVLDHWGGKKIEALNNDPNNRHHQWILVPCHKRYFALVNVATGKYLYDDGDAPHDSGHCATVDVMTDEDRRCCWTLVSYRDSTNDIIVFDSDITDPNQSTRYVIKRPPKKLPKGKGNTKAQPSQIPNNTRITQVNNRVLRCIIERLIEQVDFDSINHQLASTLVSTSRTEVLKDWRIEVPRAIQSGWKHDGWVRIDLQGADDDPDGVRIANIQGRWNSETLFHIIVPVGITFGRQRIRNAMIKSLETATPVRLDVPENAKASSSKHQLTTTQRAPCVPPVSHYWASSSTHIVGTGLLSLMLL